MTTPENNNKFVRSAVHTSGGIKKSLLTPCRRIGLSKKTNMKASVILNESLSPSYSPLNTVVKTPDTIKSTTTKTASASKSLWTPCRRLGLSRKSRTPKEQAITVSNVSNSVVLSESLVNNKIEVNDVKLLKQANDYEITEGSKEKYSTDQKQYNNKLVEDTLTEQENVNNKLIDSKVLNAKEFNAKNKELEENVKLNIAKPYDAISDIENQGKEDTVIHKQSTKRKRVKKEINYNEELLEKNSIQAIYTTKNKKIKSENSEIQSDNVLDSNSAQDRINEVKSNSSQDSEINMKSERSKLRKKIKYFEDSDEDTTSIKDVTSNEETTNKIENIDTKDDLNDKVQYKKSDLDKKENNKLITGRPRKKIKYFNDSDDEENQIKIKQSSRKRLNSESVLEGTEHVSKKTTRNQIQQNKHNEEEIYNNKSSAQESDNANNTKILPEKEEKNVSIKLKRLPSTAGWEVNAVVKDQNYVSNVNCDKNDSQTSLKRDEKEIIKIDADNTQSNCKLIGRNKSFKKSLSLKRSVSSVGSEESLSPEKLRQSNSQSSQICDISPLKDDEVRPNESDLKDIEQLFLNSFSQESNGSNSSTVPCPNLDGDDFQDFKNENYTEEKLKTLQKRINDKKAVLEELKRADMYHKKHNVDELKKLANVWKKGCQEALVDLLPILKEHREMNMPTLLKNLNISLETIGYSTEKDMFT